MEKLIPVNNRMAVVEETKDVLLYSSPQWVRLTTTGPLTPVADIAVVTHNDTTKAFRVELLNGEYVELVPVNKTLFANATVINEKGHFGHVLDNPPDELQYDINHSSKVYKTDSGWWTLIDNVRFGMGIGDWKRTFGKSMSITGNRITLDVLAVKDKAVVDNKLNLDPTATVGAATSYKTSSATAWTVLRNTGFGTVFGSTLEVITSRAGTTHTLERGALDFNTLSAAGFDKALLVLDRTGITGAAIVKAFDSTDVVAGDESAADYGELKDKYAGTKVSPTIDGTEYTFDITQIVQINAAAGIGIAELHDIDDDPPEDGETFSITFDETTAHIRFTLSAAWKAGWGYREKIEIPTSVTGSELPNFPAYAPFDNADIAARAQADGDDIIYTTDDGTTALKVDRESYSAGVGFDHVKIPLVNSDGANAVFYRYYGNPDATDTLDPEAVWDAKTDQGVPCSYLDLYMSCCMLTCEITTTYNPDGISDVNGDISEDEECFKCNPPCMESQLSINYSTDVMGVGETQLLMVDDSLFGADIPCCSHAEIKWEIVGGCGELSHEFGLTTIYTAPDHNEDCLCNVTIKLSDCCERLAFVYIAVNEVVEPIQAFLTRELTVCYSACCANNLPYVNYDGIGTVWDCFGEWYCDCTGPGTHYETDDISVCFYDMVNQLSIHCAGQGCGTAQWGIVEPFTDMRSPAEIEAGCCPPIY